MYSGSALSHKVNKLGENSVHRFRVSASNAAGQGPFSKVYEYRTALAHPPALKSKAFSYCL